MNIFKVVNFPTLLTLIRLIVSPLFFPFLLVYLLPYNMVWLNISLAVIFVLFCLTDFFDGYLARKYQQVTGLGKLLDPIADKFLMYSTLIALLVVQKIFFYWVILFIGRELFIMGLRLIALQQHIDIPVSRLGKYKTAFQMIAMTMIIANPCQSIGLGVEDAALYNTIEQVILLFGLILSLESARQYYLAFIQHYNRRIPVDV